MALPSPSEGPPVIENPSAIPSSDGQMNKLCPSQPEQTEPEPFMPADEAVEPYGTMEYAPIRPKIFFGEPDPAVRARPRRPTRFCDPLSPPLRGPYHFVAYHRQSRHA
eukprot:1960164-Pleurochrysis_carterae.AAC.1